MRKFENATIQELPQAVRDLIKANINTERTEDKDPIFTKGFLITGPTGVGKTYILHALANHFRYSFNFENWVELLQEFKDRMESGYTRDAIQQLFDKNVLVLDDIGAEKVTEWSTERLYAIINKAYERNHIVLIATNLTPTELREKYGDRIFSRLNEMCTVVELEGKDRRMQ